MLTLSQGARTKFSKNFGISVPKTQNFDSLRVLEYPIRRKKEKEP